MRNRLMQLLADNRQPKPVENRVVRAEAASEATVYLYDPIVADRYLAEWGYGVCPQDLVPAIAALDVDTIHVRIDSPGGDVFAGEAIAQALRNHRAEIVVHIDGLCASAATNIACTGDKVLAARNSMYMIHQAWTMAYGNADDLEKSVQLLRKVDGNIVAEYVRFTGGDEAQIAAWVKDETWFTADEALDAGFVTEIDNGTQTASNEAKAWNLKAYLHSKPRASGEPTKQPEATEPDQQHQDHRARQQQRLRMASVIRIV